MKGEIEAMEQALRNSYMLARRELNRARRASDAHGQEAWAHIVRFCHDGGIASCILREEAERAATRKATQ